MPENGHVQFGEGRLEKDWQQHLAGRLLYHKESRWLVDCYETIAFEKLKPKNMSKAPKPKQDEQTGDYLPNGRSPWVLTQGE